MDRKKTAVALRAAARAICATVLLAAAPWTVHSAPIACGVTQLSETPGPSMGGLPVAVSADGKRVLVLARGNPVGLNANQFMELFLVDLENRQFAQLTRSVFDGVFAEGVAASDNLRWVVFRSDQDLVGQNPTRTMQVFLFDSLNRTFRQLTIGTREFALRSFPLVISGDGKTVAIVSREDPMGENRDGSREIFIYDVETGSLRQATSVGSTFFVSTPSLSRNGRRMAVRITRSVSGVSDLALFDFESRESSVLVTAERLGDPLLSGDGSRVFFLSDIDPFALNPDRTQQVFMFVPGVEDGPALKQLTRFSGRVALEALTVSGDGSRVAFRSAADLGKWESKGVPNFYMVEVDGGRPEQATFFESGSIGDATVLNWDGSRLAFQVRGNPVGRNPDGNTEAFLAVCEPARTFFFPQVGDGVAGDIRFNTNFVFSNTGPDTAIQLEFFDTEGKPLRASMGPRGSRAFFSFLVQRGAPLMVSTAGVGPLNVGYARIRTGAGVTGTAVFTGGRASSNTTFYEAAVPLTSVLKDFTVVVNTMGDFLTGLAMVHPVDASDKSIVEEGENAHLVMRLYDETFTLLETKELDLAPGQHSAQFIDHVFANVKNVGEMLGTLTVSSDRPLAVIALRLKDDPKKQFPEEVPTLTTMPVAPGRPDLEMDTPR